ncbi:universal stress protein [Nocardia rhizosphaerihabitans]|uniref:universal stress protein n=1 Tax=Nocardia rhizosphaerihabitans TaxID=1691570 RepID=UPI00166A67B4|nr:universal stress protein [Nocardia rhizosphaerihabitans]
MRQRGTAFLDSARRIACEVDPRLRIETELTHEVAAPALIDRRALPDGSAIRSAHRDARPPHRPRRPRRRVGGAVRAARRLGEDHPRCAGGPAVHRYGPAHHLLEWSRTARLLVVGNRGRGEFRGLLRGSTSNTPVHHARCPVMVVPRAEWPLTPPIVGRVR